MSQNSALNSNIDTLRNYISNDNLKPELKPELKSEITSLITQYDSINRSGRADMNKNMNELGQKVNNFMTTNDIGPISYDGGRRRKSASSSSRHRRRRSSKQRGTQRKQKRRQRRASRRAY